MIAEGNNEERLAEITARLEATFSPESLQVDDESHLHAGHEGAKDGRGHFRVLVISDKFQDQSPIKRHRMIYQAMGDMMQSDIHALTIEAFTPDEF
jgi:stress-induced morphogen